MWLLPGHLGPQATLFTQSVCDGDHTVRCLLFSKMEDVFLVTLVVIISISPH